MDNQDLVARPARDADYPRFSRLFLELESGDSVPSETSWRQELAPQTFVLEDAREVVAYLYFQILDGIGYIRHVVVDPSHRGRGVGRRLMREAAVRILASGARRWCLNVKADNAPAIALYERFGMRLAYASTSMRLPWAFLERLPAPQAGVTTRPLAPAYDGAAEARFGIAPGLLANARCQPDRHLIEARRGSELEASELEASELEVPELEVPEVEGLAVFVPSFPGAFPFKATSPGVARALLEALKPLAESRYDYIRLVIEDAASLVAAFEAAGATRVFEMVHLAGSVPEPQTS